MCVADWNGIVLYIYTCYLYTVYQLPVYVYITQCIYAQNTFNCLWVIFTIGWLHIRIYIYVYTDLQQ